MAWLDEELDLAYRADSGWKYRKKTRFPEALRGWITGDVDACGASGDTSSKGIPLLKEKGGGLSGLRMTPFEIFLQCFHEKVKFKEGVSEIITLFQLSDLQQFSKTLADQIAALDPDGEKFRNAVYHCLAQQDLSSEILSGDQDELLDGWPDHLQLVWQQLAGGPDEYKKFKAPLKRGILIATLCRGIELPPPGEFWECVDVKDENLEQHEIRERFLILLADCLEMARGAGRLPPPLEPEPIGERFVIRNAVQERPLTGRRFLIEKEIVTASKIAPHGLFEMLKMIPLEFRELNPDPIPWKILPAAFVVLPSALSRAWPARCENI